MPGPVFVHLLAADTVPAAFAGCTAVVIDQLRASTTICAALHAGAERVVVCLEPDEARAEQARHAPGRCLTGGERESVLIPGFDLDNSPAAYTPERVGGKIVAFTTTNGTRAARIAAGGGGGGAAEIVFGCLANLTALMLHLGDDERPVRIVCAGTRGRITLEDVLVAGAICDRMSVLGRPLNMPDPREDDDSAQLALALWRQTVERPDGVHACMKRSRGGRNLIRVGLGMDVEFCSRVDVLPVVPVVDTATWSATKAPARARRGSGTLGA